MKSLPPQYARPRLAATPKFLKTALFVRLVLPEDLPRGAVDREDVRVVRRHVEGAADRERVRLLAAPRVGIDREEVLRVDAAELPHVRGRDVRQR